MNCLHCTHAAHFHGPYGCTAEYADPDDGRCECALSAEAVLELVETWDRKPPMQAA